MKTLYDEYNLSRFLNAYRTEDFVEFLNHDWFLRSWTFQEAVLANNAVVITSSATLRWDALARGLGFMCRSFPRKNIGRLHYNTMIYYRDINQRNISHESNYGWSGYEKPSLPDASVALEALLLWMKIDRWAVVPNGQLGKEDAPRSIYQDQKICFDVYNRLSTYWLILAGFRLFSLWICHRLFQWITETLSWYATAFARPYSDSYVASAISSSHVLLTHALPIGFFKYFWIGILIIASIFSMKVVGVGIIGEADKNDVRSAFDPRLDAILQTLRDRRATNPKDKSYAMYGILESLGVRLSKLDYHKSRSQIYHELLVDLLRWRPAAIGLLLDAGTTEGNSGRTEPSWVPDWSSLPLSPTMSTNFFLSSRFLDAAPSVQPHIQLEEQDRTLLVEGHWCGTVSSCVDRFQAIESLPDDLDDIKTVATLREAITAYASWVNILRTAKRPVYPRYRRPQHSISERIRHPVHRQPNCNCILGLEGQAPMRVLCNCGSHHPGVDEQKLGAIETYMLVQRLHSTEWCHQLKSMRAIHSAFVYVWETSAPESPHLCPASVSTVIDMLCKDNVLAFFICLIDDIALNDRRLFTTSEGYLGCGSKDIRMGDRLALVAGIPAPLVLRPEDAYPTDWFETKHVFVCSAFVLGWMDGSAFKSERTGVISLI